MIEFESSRLKTFFIESIIFNNDCEVACCQWKSSRSACRTYDLFLFYMEPLAKPVQGWKGSIHVSCTLSAQIVLFPPSVRRPVSMPTILSASHPLSPHFRRRGGWRIDGGGTGPFFAMGKCRLIGGEGSRSFCQYLFWSCLNQELSYRYLDSMIRSRFVNSRHLLF